MAFGKIGHVTDWYGLGARRFKFYGARTSSNCSKPCSSYLGDRHTIHLGGATIGGDLEPCPAEYVRMVDLVVERVEASATLPSGRLAQPALKDPGAGITGAVND